MDSIVTSLRKSVYDGKSLMSQGDSKCLDVTGLLASKVQLQQFDTFAVSEAVRAICKMEERDRILTNADTSAEVTLLALCASSLPGQ